MRQGPDKRIRLVPPGRETTANKENDIGQMKETSARLGTDDDSEDNKGKEKEGADVY